MANGIRLSTLRRRIEKGKVQVSGNEAARAFANLQTGVQPWMLDTHYWALPIATWDDVLRHMGVGEFTYRSEQSDCDDFAMCLRGRVPLELGINGVGVVLDFSGGHAYSAMLVADGADSLRARLLEPQAGYPSTWWIPESKLRKGSTS